MFRNRKRHALSSYLTKIDSTYNQYAVDREECRSQLERLKRDAIEMLKNGRIDEGHFLMLDEKISQYLKDLTNATAKQRTSADQTESDEATFCKNCGTRLVDDEKLCRKCGTKR
jgi:ribosomal protein L40E